jgi:hypothetical protein
MRNLIDRLAQHINQLAPHQAERETGKLLYEARAMLKKIENDAATGAAIQRAAGELPEGWDLHIEIEAGAGIVRLYPPDSDACLDDFGGGDTFAEEINAAIDYAIKHKHTQMGRKP